MHYDIDKGVKDNTGLFASRSIIVMTVILAIIGVYMGFCYSAPEIFSPTEARKQQVEESVNSEILNDNMLRIPAVGIEAPVSQKNVSGYVHYNRQSENSGTITLLIEHKTVGITPWETLRLSPLYWLGNVNLDDKIYLDFEGKRTEYKVIDFNLQTEADLIINTVDKSLSANNNNTRTKIVAKEINITVNDDNQTDND